MIIVHNEKAAVRKIRAIRERVEHPEPGMVAVGRVVARDVRRQFSSSGSFFGTPWSPLKPDYRVWKAAHGYPRNILVMSGEMRDSFTAYPMGITEIDGQRARFGSSNQKAVWHQYGTHHNGKQVNPARPILFVNPILVKHVRDTLARYIIARGSIGDAL